MILLPVGGKMIYLGNEELKGKPQDFSSAICDYCLLNSGCFFFTPVDILAELFHVMTTCQQNNAGRNCSHLLDRTTCHVFLCLFRWQLWNQLMWLIAVRFRIAMMMKLYQKLSWNHKGRAPAFCMYPRPDSANLLAVQRQIVDVPVIVSDGATAALCLKANLNTNSVDTAC